MTTLPFSVFAYFNFLPISKINLFLVFILGSSPSAVKIRRLSGFVDEDLMFEAKLDRIPKLRLFC